jgi:hypothetical protein
MEKKQNSHKIIIKCKFPYCCYPLFAYKLMKVKYRRVTVLRAENYV